MLTMAQVLKRIDSLPFDEAVNGVITELKEDLGKLNQNPLFTKEDKIVMRQKLEELIQDYEKQIQEYKKQTSSEQKDSMIAKLRKAIKWQ